MEENNNQQQPAKRRTRRKFRWGRLLCLLLFAGLLGTALFFGTCWIYNNFINPPHVSVTAADDKIRDDQKLNERINVLLLGIDDGDSEAAESEPKRTDAIILLSFDPQNNKVAVLSIPRDTKVILPGHKDPEKINAAYAYGGHNLTKGTVESFLGVPMDHYVIINIQAFQRIIDAIGGIDIDVEKRMYYEDPWDDDGGLVINLQPGMQHMDGKTAITYVRFRDEEGDIGRIGRQQKFMKAVMEKITSPAIITKLPSVIKEVMSSVKTDLSFRQLLEFAGTLKEAQKNGLKTDMVPGRPLYIEGISYWIPDITKLRQTLADTLDISMSSSMRSAMEKESREYESSIPSGATAVPSSDTSLGHSNKTSSSSSKPHSSSSSTSSSHRPSSNESSTSAPASSGKTNSQQAQPADKPAAQPSPSAGTTSTGKTQ